MGLAKKGPPTFENPHMTEEVVEVAAGFCGCARVPAPVKPLAETFPFPGFSMAATLKVAPHRVMVWTLKNLCVPYLHPWLRKLGPNPRPSNLTLTLNPKPQAQPCDPTLKPGPQETLRPNPQPFNLTVAPSLKPQTLHPEHSTLTSKPYTFVVAR